MKEIKAFIHRGRVADVVYALEQAGFRDISVIDVKGIDAKGLKQALNPREQAYSIELGERIINEAKLEVFCADTRVPQAVQLIQQYGQTHHQVTCRIYAKTVEQLHPAGSPADE